MIKLDFRKYLGEICVHRTGKSYFRKVDDKRVTDVCIEVNK